MKKITMTLLTILITGCAYALPVGNPTEASLLSDGLFFEGYCGEPCDPCMSWCDAFSFRFGFYGDYVFNRHMEVSHSDFEDRHRDIEDVELFTNAGYIALNLWDRVDFFTTLGATNFHLSTNATVTSISSTSATAFIDTRTQFSWSIGGRATLWECGCTALGLEGQYFRTKPIVQKFSLANIASVYPDSGSKYHEWQVGLGISHRINFLVPYIAAKWARSHWDFEGTSLTFGFRSKKSWGYAVGVSLIDCEKAALTVEGRFADEKAIYVNGQLRF